MPQVHVPEGEAYPTGYVYSHYAPQLGAAGSAFSMAVYQHSRLSVREMEAARYRIALINGCVMCQVHRPLEFEEMTRKHGMPLDRPMRSRGEIPGEDFYPAVADWRQSEQFSERERLAIEFSERIAEQPRSFEGDSEFWTRLHGAFSDEEIVDLTFSTASWVAMGRVTHVLELDDNCALPAAAAAE
jgi:alkylhydroperoxidase family enzyme